jgi:Uma2 family endonuclease
MALKAADNVDYPTTDGKPMAETDTHREQMTDLIQTLQWRYRDRNDVYVSGNLLFYYVKGNKRKHISPDVMVTFGIPKGRRDYYLLWVEGRAPQVVIEITSSSTRHEDMVRKKNLYLQLGVHEYFVFDPHRDYIKAQLRGWRQIDGIWVPMLRNHMYSQVLGLELRIRNHWLRLREPASGEILPTEAELAQAAEQHAQAAQAELHAERAAREHAEAELAALRAEVDRLRRQQE